MIEWATSDGGDRLDCGKTLTPSELEAFLAAQPDLSPKAWPRFVRINSEMPRAATNKILKRELIDDGVTGAGHGPCSTNVCILVCMARLNVYVPDELAERARARGLNVSALTQAAIAAELDRTSMSAWLESLPSVSSAVDHDAVMAALDAARDEFGR
jgi:post-segregation antitoxin (ccd killing protein)